MAETHHSARASWKVSEKRSLVPFSQDPHALAETAFTPYVDGDVDTVQSSYFVSEDFDLDNFGPKLVLRINEEQLEEKTGFSIDDLQINLTIRDHATKNYRCVSSWKLRERPEEYPFTTEDLAGLSPFRRMSFCVVVSLPDDVPKEFGKPHFSASVLAEKRFLVQFEKEAPQFPIKVQPPDFFRGRGLPDDTLWVVDVDADVNQAPESSVTVHLNEIAAKKLNKAFGGNVAGGLLKNQLSSEIFFDICQQTLLSACEEPVEDESLMALVVGAFESFELSGQQIRDMAQEPGGTRLRSYVQSYLKLATSIARADLRRPWQR